MRTQETPVDSKLTFTINNRTVPLTYQETLFYPVGDFKVHKYVIDDMPEESIYFDEAGSVYFDQDGHLFFITNCTINKIDVKPTDTAETVLSLLKPAITAYVDVDNYQYVEITSSGAGKEDFVYYGYKFYNKVNEYCSNFFSVGVLSDGTIMGLSIRNAEYDAITLARNIDPNVEAELIAAKLLEIYSNEISEPISYKITHSRIVSYEGKDCIQYTITCFVNNSAFSDSVLSINNSLLIPIQLLLSETNNVDAD